MRARLSNSPRLRALLWGVSAGLVAFLILALFVERFGVDVPYWDEWVELAFYAARQAGTLTWYDIWAQHNEHRIPLSRLASIALFDVLGEWNVVAQMATSAAVMGVAVAGLGYTLARLGVSPLIILAVAVLLTSPLQWENILWGYQIHCFTLLLGIVLAIGAVTLDAGLRARTVALAILGCVIASFSFASGLAVWPAIGATMALRAVLLAGSPRALLASRPLLLRLGAFALAAIACAALYFRGYTAPHNELGAPSPWAFAIWMLRVLGYPLLEAPTVVHLALATALWACVALALAGYARRRDSAAARDRLVFCSGLLLVLLASAAIIGYGRGAASYVPSRYATIFLLNGVLWLVAVADLLAWSGARRGAATARVALCAVAAGLLIVHGSRYLQGLETMRQQGENRLVAREAAAFYLRDHSPNLPFQGFAIFPPHVQQQGDLGRAELIAMLPPEMRPALSAPPATTVGDAWAVDCGYGATAGPHPTHSWGSWCRNGPAGTGRIVVGPIAIDAPLLRVPIAGQVGTAGASLIIQDVADPRRRLAYAGPPPGDAWQDWDADVQPFVGGEVVLIGLDAVRRPPGWLAFGRPRPMSHAVWWLDRLLRHAGLALQIVLLSGLGILLAHAHRRAPADAAAAAPPPRAERRRRERT